MNVRRPGAMKLFADGDIDLLNDTIKLVLLEDTYTYSAAHDFLNDVLATHRAYTHTLTAKNTTDGTFTAASVIVTIPAGPAITSAWLFKDTGVESTSPLIVYYDEDESGQPIDFTPDGTDVLLSLPDLPNGLFTL